MMDTEEVQIDENTTLTVSNGVALEAVDRAAIDMQIATAKRYPRSIEKFRRDAISMATLDEDTAKSMFYSLPRSGKTIVGPSARMAEVVVYSWGNLRADADIVAEEDKYVVAMGTCFDLERNVAIRVRVTRGILDKNGRRFNDDMIGVTKNAAISIALRNAVFKVVPFSMVKPIFEAAKTAATGKGTIIEKRKRAADLFAKLGITPAQLFAVLGVKGESEVGEEELIVLAGLWTAIDQGETTVEQVFSPRAAANGNGGGTDINERIRRKEAATTEARANLVDYVAHCTPDGGDALAGQRAEARTVAMKVFADGSDELEAVYALSEHAKLGKDQASTLCKLLDACLP